MNHRDKLVAVRLTPEEHARLSMLRAKSGLTTSALFRKLLMGTKIRERPPEAIRDLYVEVNRIGVNINQVARQCNAGLTEPDSAARQMLFLLQKVYERVDGLGQD